MRLSLVSSDLEGGKGAANRLFCMHVSLKLDGVEQDGVVSVEVESRALLVGRGGVLKSAILCVSLHPLTGETALFKLFDIDLIVHNCDNCQLVD